MPDEVFRWVVAVGVVVACIAFIWQAVLLATMYRAGKEALQAGRDAQAKIGPLLERTQAILTSTSKILEENRPRLSEITAEMLAIARTARQQSERVSTLISETEQRARNRIEQIDHTVDQTVQQVEQAGDAVKSAVMKPVREVSGIMNGVRAAVSTYAEGTRRPSVEHVTQDEEMFI
jgi:methyl-accepting chemotaxis protein